MEEHIKEFLEKIKGYAQKGMLLGTIEDLNVEGCRYDCSLLFITKEGLKYLIIPPMTGWEYDEYDKIVKELWGEPLGAFTEDELLLNMYLRLTGEEEETIRYRVELNIRPNCATERVVKLNKKDKDKFIKYLKTYIRNK